MHHCGLGNSFVFRQTVSIYYKALQKVKAALSYNCNKIKCLLDKIDTAKINYGNENIV